MTATEPRLFHLQRDNDVSGVSGLGRVADGVRWADGAVTLRWHGEHQSTSQWASLDSMRQVHGHGGATVIVWHDQPADVLELPAPPRGMSELRIAIDADCPSCGFPERWLSPERSVFGCSKCGAESSERDA